MKELLLVGLGGFLGSIARYKISTLLLAQTLRQGFPLGTLCVNILGCFLIGILAGLDLRLNSLGQHGKLLLITGLLGGFTTFSAFGLETMALMKRQQIGMAVGNIVLSVCLGLLAVWLGGRLSLPR